MRTRVTRIYLSHSMTFLYENTEYKHISHFKMLSDTFYQTFESTEYSKWDPDINTNY